MLNTSKSIAYIDGANLDKALRNIHGWDMDYGVFRVWLKEKYNVEIAYIFIGLIPKYRNLYLYLSESGFTLVFKDVVYRGLGNKPKGNCDADLLLKVCEDFYEGVLNKAVLVSSDGDFTSLVKKLIQASKLEVILSPSSPNKCSVLLKKTNAKIVYINDKRSLLERKIGDVK